LLVKRTSFPTFMWLVIDFVFQQIKKFKGIESDF
jgi:hypothetical protein